MENGSLRLIARGSSLLRGLSLSFALACAPPAVLQAAAMPIITLHERQSRHLLGTDLLVFRDRGGELGIAEISSPEGLRQFGRVRERRPNIGYTNDTVWFRFTLLNAGAEPDWILDVGREWIEEVTLFTRAGDGSWQRLDTGARLPYRLRPQLNDRLALPIRLGHGEQREFFLRIRSENTSIALLLQLTEAAQFAADNAVEKLSFGGFYAVLLVMALYNLILGLALHDRLFLLLTATLFSYALGEAGAHGHLSYLLLPSLPMVSHRISIVALALATLCVMLLTRQMLQTRRFAPAIHKALSVLMPIPAVAALLSAVSLRAHQAVFWTAGIGAIAVVVAGVARFLKQDRSAAFFTVALVAWLIPVWFQVGGILGLLPLFPLTEHGAHVGGVLMTVLLSLGVAEQVNRVNVASQRFLPKPILARLGHSSITEVCQGDAREDEMTVMFCDIRDFTTRAEQMSPAGTFSFLNTYLGYVVPPIERHGGLIDKYMGDGIMALFPDSADDALAASLELQQAVRRMNERLPDGCAPVSVGVGLHRGKLVLGTVGDRHRLDVTVISDAVNAASRLESLTKVRGEGIIASSAVIESLRRPGDFTLEKIGAASLKGRVQSIDIWAVKMGATPRA